MITLSQLVFQIDIRALLKGRVVLPRVSLLKPVIRIESAETGELNWLLLTQSETAPPPPSHQASDANFPTIGQVTLHAGRLIRRDYSTDTTLAGTFSALRVKTVGPEQAIEVRGAGQFEHMPFQLTIHAGDLPTLQANAPYPLQVQLTLHKAYVELAGQISKPLALTGVALDVFLEEHRAPDQVDSADSATSSQPLYRFTSHLSRHDGVWEVDKLTGTLGKSELAEGHLTVTIQDQRPFLRAGLSFDTLNIDNLTNIFAGPQESAPKQDSESNAPSSGRLLDVQVTRAVNVDLQFQGQQVIVAEQTLNQVSATAVLQDGHLTLKPTFALAGGTLAGTVSLNTRQDPLHSAVQVTIDEVDLQQVMARFNREQTATGIVNGRIDLTASGRTLLALLKSIDGKASLNMTDQASATDVTIHFATPEHDTEEAARMVTLQGEGHMRGQAVQIQGRIGVPYPRHAAMQPYPVQVTVHLGETQVEIDGTLTQPQQLTRIDAQVAVKGPDPATLSTFLPVSLPHLPAYQFEGQLVHNEQSWTLNSFTGSLGQSDIAGTLAVDLGGERPFLRGTLRSQHLHMNELMATTAPNEPQEATSQEQATSDHDAARRAIPDMTFAPKLLQRLNADVRFQGEDVRVSKLSFTNVALTVHLEQDHLRVIPKGSVDGGTMQATIDASSRQGSVAGRIQSDIKQVDLNRVLSKFDLKHEAFGRVDAHIDLTGQGQSLASWLAASNGDVSLTMAGGQLHSLLVELVGLDVGESIIAAFAGKKEQVPIRCLVADFIVSDGRMQTQMLAFDTADTKLTGEGFIDLGKEFVHLKLVPKAKDFSLFSAEAPVYIKGPLTDISAGPKIGDVLLSLAMPIKVGKDANVDCRALFDATKRQSTPSSP